MSNPMIKVNNLSKRYRIGAAERANKSFREAIVEGITAPLKNLGRLRNLTRFDNGDEENTIWALKDVCFEVNRGEVVGVIGKNGSGKSTLLKILSRITEPTSGSAEIHGRVSSLLEVGTGFHPELTGRENIFLNGAILGMRKKEIENKFDEIVAFSEIEKFIDTPVKRYSSGMHVRLAFAVAAHLEPEILLVDEVLAVGDAGFQKKCLGKMESLAGAGRTLLFVSHNMAAIKGFCPRTILLNQGKMVEDGMTDRVVKHYLGSGVNTNSEKIWNDVNTAPGDDVVRFHVIRAKNGKGEVTAEFNIQEPVYLEMEFWVLQEGWSLTESFHLSDESGLLIFVTGNSLDPAWHNRKRPVGFYRSMCCIPGNLLNEGTFIILAAIVTGPMVAHVIERDAINFHVFDPGSGGVRGDYTREWPSVAIRPWLEWKTEQVTANAYDACVE